MSELFIIESLTVDGEALPIEDSSATVENLLGYEKEAIASSQGDHFSMRKRVVPTVKANILFAGTMTTEDLNKCNVQLVLKQSGGCGDPKRVRLSKCETASVGTIGEGAVEVNWNVLGRAQWL